MTSAKFPDFYILGAPKCGTTALYEYIKEHSRVFLPEIKEPHYFARDFPRFQRIKSEKAYLDLFSPAPTDAIRGEASVWYLYSGDAIPAIVSVRPDAKFIVMLRNPIDAAEALHAQKLSSLAEDIQDFENAWRAQPDRLAGRGIPLHCLDVKHLQYGEIFKYSWQLDRLFSLASRDQVLVVIYEEFFANPQASFEQVQTFLGLQPEPRRTFERFNPSRSPRYKSLHRFLSRPPFPLDIISSILSKISRRYGLRLGRLAMALVRMEISERTAMRPEFRRELADFFAHDLDDVERLLGRPVAAWRGTA